MKCHRLLITTNESGKSFDNPGDLSESTKNVTIRNSPHYHPAEGVNYEEIDAKDPDTLTEVEKVALLGRPCLGDITKIQIRIRESKEFKVTSRGRHINTPWSYVYLGKAFKKQHR